MVKAELIIRTLCDTELETCSDGAYLFGQSIDNQESVFKTALRLVKQQKVKSVLIQSAEAGSGYPGFDLWHTKLIAYGLRTSDIIGVPKVSESILHTGNEAEVLIKFAKTMGFSSIYVVASPFHQLRAFINTVTHVLRLFPELRVYSMPGVTLPWYEFVTHSQGTLQAIRQELIHGELERIERYHQKGDLASDDEVLDYLRWRDS